MSRLPFVALGGALFLYMCEPAAAIVGKKRCTLQAPGDACIFDLHTNAAGTLRVCTQALTADARWRSTVGRTNAAGGSSAVGSGTTACTGAAATSVVANKDYQAIVALDRPKAGGFPRQVDVTIDAPVATVPNPRPNNSGGGGTEACGADVSELSCGTVVTCRLDPSGDTDLFEFSVPSGSRSLIRLEGTGTTAFDLFDPMRNRIGGGERGFTLLPVFSVPGTYKIEVKNGFSLVTDYSLVQRGVAQPDLCGVPISYGQTKEGTFFAGEIDAYQFVGTSGQTLSITIAGPRPLSWTLYDPLGNFVASSESRAQVTIGQSGRFTIVAVNGFNLSGNYSLTLQRLF